MTAIPLPRDRAALAGWALLALFGLFMLGASVLPKPAMPPMVTDGMAALGWPGFPARPIGLLELTLAFLELWQRTGPLGGVLTTGLLGGAVATQLQAGSPWMTHTLFGVWLGALMWAGPLLRDPRVRAAP